MTAADPAVTIIVPTRGLRERAASLQAAIESALDQAGVHPTVVVVLNGPDRSPDVERALRDDDRVRLVVLEKGGLPAALAAGRTLVETPWFTALDDDDLLLPGALALRVRELERRGDCAAIVTNGYRRNGNGDELHVKPGNDVNADPIRAMLEGNWLLPGSWLCRSDLIGVSVFEEMPSFLECTYLALRIASEHGIAWIDTPTVVYHLGSHAAESSSRAYLVGQVDGLRQIIALDLPEDVRRGLRSHIAGAYHAAADKEREFGALRNAWRWHLASLLQPSGWHYLLYTRHLLRDALRRRS
ncbi:MAG: glycosyltransferase family 2 protein [Gemmatimonadota bacterium]|nr:glycosyltransferase family 2 protein [Gemmatimonadota bacterium]